MIKNSRSYFYLIKDLKSICEVESQVIASKYVVLKKSETSFESYASVKTSILALYVESDK